MSDRHTDAEVTIVDTPPRDPRSVVRDGVCVWTVTIAGATLPAPEARRRLRDAGVLR
jgi:hypothetical protein